MVFTAQPVTLSRSSERGTANALCVHPPLRREKCPHQTRALPARAVRRLRAISLVSRKEILNTMNPYTFIPDVFTPIQPPEKGMLSHTLVNDDHIKIILF